MDAAAQRFRDPDVIVAIQSDVVAGSGAGGKIVLPGETAVLQPEGNQPGALPAAIGLHEIIVGTGPQQSGGIVGQHAEDRP